MAHLPVILASFGCHPDSYWRHLGVILTHFGVILTPTCLFVLNWPGHFFDTQTLVLISFILLRWLCLINLSFCASVSRQSSNSFLLRFFEPLLSPPYAPPSKKNVEIRVLYPIFPLSTLTKFQNLDFWPYFPYPYAFFFANFDFPKKSSA